MMREEDLDLDVDLTTSASIHPPTAELRPSGCQAAISSVAHPSSTQQRGHPREALPVPGVSLLCDIPADPFSPLRNTNAGVAPGGGGGGNSGSINNTCSLPGSIQPHLVDVHPHYAAQGVPQSLQTILEEGQYPPEPPLTASFDKGCTATRGNATLHRQERSSSPTFPYGAQPTGRRPSVHLDNPPNTQPLPFNPTLSTNPVYTYPVSLTPSYRANPTPNFPVALTPSPSASLPLPQPPASNAYSLPTNLKTLSAAPGGEASHSYIPYLPTTTIPTPVTPFLPTPYQPTLTPAHLSPRAQAHLSPRAQPHLSPRAQPYLSPRAQPHLSPRAQSQTTPHLSEATSHKTPLEAIMYYASRSPSASSPPLVPSQLSYPPPRASHGALQPPQLPISIYGVTSLEPPPPYKHEEVRRVSQGYVDETTALLGRSSHSHVESYGGTCSGTPWNEDAGRKESNICAPCGKRRFSRQQVLMLVSMLIMDFASFATMSILAPFFPKLVEERGLSRTVDGVIFSVYAGVVAVASPVIGRMLPHCSPFTIYIGGIFTTACACICFGFIPSIEATEFLVMAAITLRAVSALGAAAFLTVIYTVVPALFPDDVSTVNGMLETSIGVGMSVGPSLGSWLYTIGGFALPFYALGGFLLVLVPVNYFMFPENAARKPSRAKEVEVSLLTVLRDPLFVLVFLILATTAVCNGMLYPTLQPHMDELGVSVQRVGLVYLLLSAVYAVAAPLVGLATDRYNCPYALLFSGLVGTAVSLLLLGNSPIFPYISSELLVRQDVAAIVVLGVASGMAVVPTYAAMLEIATRYTPDPQGPVSLSTYSLVGGMWSSAYSLGEMVGPLYAGLLFDYFTLDVITTITAILPIVLCVILGITMCMKP